MLCKIVGKSLMSWTDKSSGEFIEKGTAHVIWQPDPDDDEMEGSRVQIITGLNAKVFKSINVGSEYEPMIKTKSVKDSYGNQISKAIIYSFTPAK